MDDYNRDRLDITAGLINKKIVLLVIVVLLFIIVSVVSIFILTRKTETVQTGLTKNPVNSEALQAKSTSNNSLESMKQAIVEKEKAERLKQEKLKLEEEKKKLAEERKKQAENNTTNSTSQTNSSNEQPVNFRADGRSDSEDKDAPLPKSLRMLSGETLVMVERNDSNKEREKDYLQGGEYADGSVKLLKNRRYLLSAGVILNCSLITKIVTAYPAITLCQLDRDIFSDDGKTLLVRRGALLQGEQKKAITQGIARVFVNWTTIKDGNITIRVDALGTDNLGAAGIPAWMDTHFVERFGNSLLLSLIGDTMESAKNLTQRNSGNQGSVTYENTSDATQQQAAIALQNSINIAPTGYINQGTVISVLVPRNIDFSSVYEVQ
ncbi:TrbI/VirB10 family protein [Salmonella enterica]|nr:TrbI/VirB10 family protein [Salmonella enterica]